MEFSSSDEDGENMLDLAYVNKKKILGSSILWLQKGKTDGTFDVMRKLYPCTVYLFEFILWRSFFLFIFP